MDLETASLRALVLMKAWPPVSATICSAVAIVGVWMSLLCAGTTGQVADYVSVLGDGSGKNLQAARVDGIDSDLAAGQQVRGLAILLIHVAHDREKGWEGWSRRGRC